jgi:hypothetical protein
MLSFLFRLVVVLLVGMTSGCKSDSSSPASPTASSSRVIALTGSLAFGNVEVGNTRDLDFTISNSGTAALTVTGITAPSAYSASWTSGTIAAGGSQLVTVRFSPTQAQSHSGTLTVAADHTGGTNTIGVSGTGVVPAGPRTSFGAGTHRVGSDIAAGRYFTDPATSCYWERVSGFGGTLGEILANDFVGFDAAQLIVDILPSDLGFKTEPACRTWFNTPRFGGQSTIRPGTWLVSSQITPGTYRAAAGPGCYWERLRDFTGNISGVIANDFVSGGGTQLVTISGGDLGFHGDGDCGTWTREPGLSPGTALIPNDPQSSDDIDRKRSLNRR